ncbi:MAG: hypothetical protein AUK55_10755 [Syntrophobacteraceae bacterium CG2_30_61_12]|nr:MAG: hypothetical protein AUK55_10755 [Syntrophobacteraceae bacterium CG2_30_61_12]
MDIVSLGPGSRDHLTPQALSALRAAEVVVGYQTYLELIDDLLVGKEIVSGAMRKEVERCGKAIDLALAGRRVALVSSGDAGIYGMAGLVFDLCRKRGLRVLDAEAGARADSDGDTDTDTDTDREERLRLSVIPGVAAFNAAASLLGAPLMHDFAAISLSDHLTPWEQIEKRLDAAAAADFVLALYNPRSKARPDLLGRALDIVRRHRAPATPVGILHKAMRDGQRRLLVRLDQVPLVEVDMQSVLLIGNSRTYTWGDWMITPRGYLDKYES